MQPEAVKILLIGVSGLSLLVVSFIWYIFHLRRVAPPKLDPALLLTGPEADKRFSKLDGEANLYFVLVIACFCVLLYPVFYATYALRIMLLPRAVMTFPIGHEFLWFCAGITGVGLALIVSGSVIRRLLGDDGRWYLAYASVRRYGCDYERLCRGLGSAIIVVVLLLFPFGVNSYVQARDTAFVVHPFFALHESVHPYADIEGIDTANKFVAPNGRVRRGRDYVVRFKDGTHWVDRDMPSGDGYDHQRVIDMLAKRARVTINELPIFKTSDLYN